MVDKKLLAELFDPKIQRYEVGQKKSRKREEEMLQRHLTNYLNMNFTQKELPRWAVRNELPTPPTGEDPELWAMRHGKRAKDMGVLAGVHDYHFFYRGKFRTMELKAPKGKASKSQRDFAEAIKSNGGECYIVYSVEAAHAIICNWGLRPRHSPAALNAASKKLLTQQAVAKELYSHDD
jgi:hypothetical protein